jgi:hypothetical protein
MLNLLNLGFRDELYANFLGVKSRKEEFIDVLIQK